MPDTKVLTTCTLCKATKLRQKWRLSSWSGYCKACFRNGEPKLRKETPEYNLRNIWHLMLYRCYNPKHPSYRLYGARGIKVNSEWHDLIVFTSWAIKNGYKKGLTLERINNSGNYQPLNCKWATVKEQGRNRRTTKLTIDIVKRLRNDYKGSLLGPIKFSKLVAPNYNMTPIGVYYALTGKTWS